MNNIEDGGYAQDWMAKMEYDDAFQKSIARIYEARRRDQPPSIMAWHWDHLPASVQQLFLAVARDVVLHDEKKTT